jgi:putative oxidoreductase
MTAITANDAPSSAAPGKALHYGLWVAQFLLAAAFLMAGSGKATQPVEALAPNMPWVTAVPVALLRFIGTAEFLAGIGLLLPSLTRIKPILTPLAAAGLVTIMALAIPFHLVRGEYFGMVVNSILGSIAAFIAWGRYKKAPIAARS